MGVVGTPFSRDSKEYRFGHEAEELVVRALARTGWHVVRAFDYTSAKERAPLTMHQSRPLILPDIDAFHAGKGRIWIDSKAKKLPTLHRNSGRVEHGFSSRHVHDYLTVERESKCPVFIVVCEEVTRLAMKARLAQLLRRARVSNSPRMGNMTFFLRKDFEPWFRLEGSDFILIPDDSGLPDPPAVA